MVAFVGPFFWQWDYQEAVVSEANQAPSWRHPFGTDDIGQDLLARMMRGIQRSTYISLIFVLVAGSLGVLIGAIASSAGGGALGYREAFGTIAVLVAVMAVASLGLVNRRPA
jgi:peptide/nickel transport system permease protein